MPLDVRVSSWLSFLLPAALFFITLEPVVASWDVGEMQTVPYILGIAHTTGYPTFVLLGWVFTHAFAVGEVAWRMNLLCALYLAAACWAIDAIQMRIGVRPVIALLVTLLFATGPIVWAHALRADVMSLTVLFVALIALLLVRWAMTGERWCFLVMCLLAGLGMGNHLLILWTFPGLAAFVAMNRQRLVRGDAVRGTALFLAGLSVYAYLPIRSAVVTAHRYDRTLELGFPPGHPFWDYAHPADLGRFAWLVSGSQVAVPTALRSMLDVHGAITGIGHAFAMTLAEFSIVGVVALLAGIGIGFHRQRALTIYAITGTLLIALFTAAFGAETDPDRYYMVPFALLSVFIGLGFSAVVDRVAASPGRTSAAIAGTLTAGLLALLLVGGYRNQEVFGWHRYRWGEEYIARVRSQTPPNAIVVAPWVYATPLAYAAYVDGSLGDRIVETGDIETDTSYLPGWIARRPIYVIMRQRTPAGFSLRLVQAGDPSIYRLAVITR